MIAPFSGQVLTNLAAERLIFWKKSSVSGIFLLFGDAVTFILRTPYLIRRALSNFDAGEMHMATQNTLVSQTTPTAVLTKTVTPTGALPGDTVTYTLTFQNRARLILIRWTSVTPCPQA